MSLRSLVYLTFFSISLNSHAVTNSCEELMFRSYDPEFNKIANGLGEEHATLLRFLTGQVSQRYKYSSDKGFLELKNLITDCTEKECSVILSSDTFEFYGKTQIKEKGATLEIVINSIRAKERRKLNKKRKSIPFSKSPKGVSSVFVNFMGVLFSSIHDVIRSHSEISTVRVIGSQVINKKLAVMLESYGFTKTKITRNSNLLGFSLKAVAGVFISSTAKSEATDISNKELGVISSASKALLATLHLWLRKREGADWTLEIPLVE